LDNTTARRRRFSKLAGDPMGLMPHTIAPFY